jgi:hypothetical protein
MNIPLLFGPYGSGAVKYIEQFSRNGVNALWFHMFDARAFDACQQHGIHACVEFKTFRADFDKRPELIPIGVDGKPIRYGSLVQGVCLSNQAFLQETEQHLVDGLQAFEPAGIWFDYLTYVGWFETPEPDLQESCFCAACVAEFCQAKGVDAQSPQEILSNHQALWTQHKCERIAAFGRRYADQVRSYRPQTVTGAYMCPWTPQEFDGALRRIFAQDYQLLADVIDVFTPLIYAHKSGRPAQWGREFLEQSPDFIPSGAKIQLILDMLDFPESLQSTAESAVPSWGVQLFGGERAFEEPAHARLLQQSIETIRHKISG